MGEVYGVKLASSPGAVHPGAALGEAGSLPAFTPAGSIALAHLRFCSEAQSSLDHALTAATEAFRITGDPALSSTRKKLEAHCTILYKLTQQLIHTTSDAVALHGSLPSPERVDLVRHTLTMQYHTMEKALAAARRILDFRAGAPAFVNLTATFRDYVDTMNAVTCCCVKELSQIKIGVTAHGRSELRQGDEINVEGHRFILLSNTPPANATFVCIRPDHSYKFPVALSDTELAELTNHGLLVIRPLLPTPQHPIEMLSEIPSYITDWDAFPPGQRVLCIDRMTGMRTVLHLLKGHDGQPAALVHRSGIAHTQEDLFIVSELKLLCPNPIAFNAVSVLEPERPAELPETFPLKYLVDDLAVRTRSASSELVMEEAAGAVCEDADGVRYQCIGHTADGFHTVHITEQGEIAEDSVIYGQYLSDRERLAPDARLVPSTLRDLTEAERQTVQWENISPGSVIEWRDSRGGAPSCSEEVLKVEPQPFRHRQNYTVTSVKQWADGRIELCRRAHRQDIELCGHYAVTPRILVNSLRASLAEERGSLPPPTNAPLARHEDTVVESLARFLHGTQPKMVRLALGKGNTAAGDIQRGMDIITPGLKGFHGLLVIAADQMAQLGDDGALLTADRHGCSARMSALIDNLDSRSTVVGLTRRSAIEAPRLRSFAEINNGEPVVVIDETIAPGGAGTVTIEDPAFAARARKFERPTAIQLPLCTEPGTDQVSTMSWDAERLRSQQLGTLLGIPRVHVVIAGNAGNENEIRQALTEGAEDPLVKIILVDLGTKSYSPDRYARDAEWCAAHQEQVRTARTPNEFSAALTWAFGEDPASSQKERDESPAAAVRRVRAEVRRGLDSVLGYAVALVNGELGRGPHADGLLTLHSNSPELRDEDSLMEALACLSRSGARFRRTLDPLLVWDGAVQCESTFPPRDPELLPHALKDRAQQLIEFADAVAARTVPDTIAPLRSELLSSRQAFTDAVETMDRRLDGIRKRLLSADIEESLSVRVEEGPSREVSLLHRIRRLLSAYAGRDTDPQFERQGGLYRVPTIRELSKLFRNGSTALNCLDPEQGLVGHLMYLSNDSFRRCAATDDSYQFVQEALNIFERPAFIRWVVVDHLKGKHVASAHSRLIRALIMDLQREQTDAVGGLVNLGNIPSLAAHLRFGFLPFPYAEQRQGAKNPWVLLVMPVEPHLRQRWRAPSSTALLRLLRSGQASAYDFSPLPAEFRDQLHTGYAQLGDALGTEGILALRVTLEGQETGRSTPPAGDERSPRTGRLVNPPSGGSEKGANHRRADAGTPQ